MFGLVACSGSHPGVATATVVSPTTATATTTVAAAVTTTAVASTTAAPAPAATTTGSTAAPVPDPGAALQQALDSLTTTYHFVSTVTLDGTVALVADGDRVGDGSRLTLTSNDGNASYVVTADGSWVMLPGGDWQELDDDPATADPIGALRAPSAVQATSTDGTTSHLSVTVAPASLGIAGDAPVELDVAITANVLSSVSYATVVGDKPATVTATFGPAQDPTPVGAPA